MKRSLKIAAILLAVSFFVLFNLKTWPTLAQTTQKAETAGQKFKNIKVLTDMPADQLGQVMNIVSASLGVKCSYCHVGEDFEKDDKRNKQTARKMMAMTLDINKNSFNNRPQVSCNTCHNGHEQPQGVPNLNPAPEPERPVQPADKDKPTVDQIIDKYLNALGGTTKLAAVKTRYVKASRVEPGGEVSEPETIWFNENKYTLSTEYDKTTVSEGYDGSSVWKTTNTGAIPLKPDEADQIKREAELFMPQNIKTIYPKMDFRFIDLVNGHPAYLVIATTASGARERLYFDVQSGLLVRRAATTPTMLGNFVYQVDYSDYKLFGSVKIPTTIDYAMPNIRWTRKLIQVKNNAPVDAVKFNGPAGKS